MNARTQNQLVKIIIETADTLADGVEVAGFDWKEVAAQHEAAKLELATRFGKSVGYGGVLSDLPL